MWHAGVLRSAGCFLVSVATAAAFTPAQRSKPIDPSEPTIPAIIGSNIDAALEAAVETLATGRTQASAVSRRVAAARKAFWSQYPNGPGFVAAQREFAAALVEKDIAIALLMAGQGTLLIDPRTIDGGIPDEAELAFRFWLAAGPWGSMNKASAAKWFASRDYELYKRDRDWAEFVKAGKVTGPRPKAADENFNQKLEAVFKDLANSCDRWARAQAAMPGAPSYLQLKEKHCICSVSPMRLSDADLSALLSDWAPTFRRLYPTSPCVYPPGSGVTAPRSAPAPTVIARPQAVEAAPRKLKHVDPVYPERAREAKVQGTVVIQITIAADGRVAEARVIQSNPLLNQAALDAVRQWTYEATGAKQPVTLTVRVPFSLPEE